MSKHKIEATSGQWNKLLADLRTTQKAQPIGPCLTNDEAVGYTMEMLSLAETQRVETHLASCADCTEEMERLMEASVLWDGEESTKRLENVRDIIRAKMANAQNQPAEKKSLAQIAAQLARFILPVGLPTPAPLRTKHLVSSTDRQAEDARFLRCREIPDEQGNLVLRIASHELMDGTRLLLFVEGSPWQRVVRLSHVTPDQVGARLEITREEREAWPANAMLEFGIPLEDLDQAPERGER